jgi:hypothetical protein
MVSIAGLLDGSDVCGLLIEAWDREVAFVARARVSVGLDWARGLCRRVSDVCGALKILLGSSGTRTKFE